MMPNEKMTMSFLILHFQNVLRHPILSSYNDRSIKCAQLCYLSFPREPGILVTFPPIILLQAEYAAESGGTMSTSTAQRTNVTISEGGLTESIDQHKRTEKHKKCCLTT